MGQDRTSGGLTLEEASERLMRALDQHGLTQADVARITGYNDSSVHRWVSRERYIPMPAVAKLCRATGISPQYLLGLEDELAGVTRFEKRKESCVMTVAGSSWESMRIGMALAVNAVVNELRCRGLTNDEIYKAVGDVLLKLLSDEYAGEDWKRVNVEFEKEEIVTDELWT